MKRILLITMLSIAITSIMANQRIISLSSNIAPSEETKQNVKFLSKEQAALDIDSLIYTISEVHPDMFFNCKPGEFIGMTNDILESLPDSISVGQLYTKLQPLIVKIGDGHTTMHFPYNEVLGEYTPRIPIRMFVTPENKIKVLFSVDNKIPAESEIVKINGISKEDMIKNMLRYESGESNSFKAYKMREGFNELFVVLYPSDSFNIEYIEPDKRKHCNIELSPCTNKEYLTWKKTQKSTPQVNKAPYSYKILPEKNTAIMDFNSFEDEEKMKSFADSMFTALKKNNITNLIIDIRENGGGNSNVGDSLFRYISPKPFAQFSKLLARVTPTTKKLIFENYKGNPDLENIEFNIGWGFAEIPEEEMIQPRTEEEGHFDGKVYLLTSNYTFSSASSFSWAFKEFGMGTVVGEETGGMNICFGDVLRYKLPLSGLLTQISYKCFWQYGADENDIHGTIPDYIVPKADALTKALKLCKH